MPSSHREEVVMNNGLIWAVVGVLAVIALVIFIVNNV
jgi:uncharacterized integral membrane protein